MDKVAIFVDGAFYLFRAKHYWKDKSAEDRANELYTYCMNHLWVPCYDRDGKKSRRDELYRIFFYDCPPSEKKVFNPLTKAEENLGLSEQFKFRTDFHEELRSKRKVALRFGDLLDNSLEYSIKPYAVKKLLNGTLKLEDLKQEHMKLNVIQKGVDMRIGIDIASLAYKKQVTKMILISGDSDFVTAAKLARREGIDFVLDSMGIKILPKLNEHIDGRRSFLDHDPESDFHKKAPPGSKKYHVIKAGKTNKDKKVST